MLVIPTETTCENFKSFEANLDNASFSFLDHKLQNKQNFKKKFQPKYNLGPITSYLSLEVSYCVKIGTFQL